MGTSECPKMGSIVTVTRELKRMYDYGSDSLWWESVDVTPRAGWVVGWRWLLKGTRVFDYDDPPRFQETGPRTLAILVAYWPTMNPVRAPVHGWCYGGRPLSPSGTEEQVRMAKEAYAQNPEAYPRDDAGRFIPAESKGPVRWLTLPM